MQNHLMKIMIVEDHKAMRFLLKSMVMSYFKNAIEIIECEDGENAITQYRLHQPDCVLMDIELSKLDGFETTKIISSEYNEAKIVFVSSCDSLEFRERAKKLNAIGFVSKERLSDIYDILQSI